MVHLLLIIIYIAFISLGLPDTMLGSAWPTMYLQMGVPISYAGIISMIIAVGTSTSSLFSDMLTKRLGAGKITAISVAMTAAALFGFSVSNSFFMLCLCAVPYGLGAGGVDAALNNYVAVHYASRHMSWLHCMWGVGTVIGPNVMGYVLASGMNWNTGYLYISVVQIVLSAFLFISLPVWKKSVQKDEKARGISPLKALKIPGAREIVISFFCYCALEQTTMLWTGSYLVLHGGISEETAASLASVFAIGITLGRMISGFLTFKFNDTQMIRMGQGILILGGIILFLPTGTVSSAIGIVLIGLGCAPIYPCIIHSTPWRFGEENSQAMIGIQMTSANMGACLMPPVFGIIANHINISLMPVYLLLFAAVMVLSHERLIQKTK